MAVTRRHLLRNTAAVVGASSLSAVASQRAGNGPCISSAPDTRADWRRILDRVSLPVLTSAARGSLAMEMPVELSPGGRDRAIGSPLEAFGRLISGIAPYLQHEEAKHLLQLAQAGLAHAVDSRSPGYLRFGESQQTLVDSAFLSLGLLRAPKQLIASLGSSSRKQLIDALVKQRSRKPGMNNWLLFAAMNEALLYSLGAEWKREPVELALSKHAEWYKGDGVYGDGPHFHFDYYNSFVIQPFLLQIGDTLGLELPGFAELFAAEKLRAKRYAAIQERLIAPDGTYPAVGRSITYRCGAFHHLADAALREKLPEGLPANQVRSALSAVIHRTVGAPHTFDGNGWLTIGLAGHQPSLGEGYISTGSLYLCAAVFLPLGLPESNLFWSGPSVPWTSQRLWSGQDVHTDHAVDQ